MSKLIRFVEFVPELHSTTTLNVNDVMTYQTTLDVYPEADFNYNTISNIEVEAWTDQSDGSDKQDTWYAISLLCSEITKREDGTHRVTFQGSAPVTLPRDFHFTFRARAPGQDKWTWSNRFREDAFVHVRSKADAFTFERIHPEIATEQEITVNDSMTYEVVVKRALGATVVAPKVQVWTNQCDGRNSDSQWHGIDLVFKSSTTDKDGNPLATYGHSMRIIRAHDFAFTFRLQCPGEGDIWKWLGQFENDGCVHVEMREPQIDHVLYSVPMPTRQQVVQSTVRKTTITRHRVNAR